MSLIKNTDTAYLQIFVGSTFPECPASENFHGYFFYKIPFRLKIGNVWVTTVVTTKQPETYGTPLKKLTFYGRTTPTATGVLCSRLRAYYAYGYGRITPTATGVLRLRLQRTMPTATGVLRLRLRACYVYGYGRTRSKAMGVLHLRLRVYRGYNYGRATGVQWACGRV